MGLLPLAGVLSSDTCGVGSPLSLVPDLMSANGWRKVRVSF